MVVFPLPLLVKEGLRQDFGSLIRKAERWLDKVNGEHRVCAFWRRLIPESEGCFLCKGNRAETLEDVFKMMDPSDETVEQCFANCMAALRLPNVAEAEKSKPALRVDGQYLSI
jgi:DNA-directed RNA polymerase sigma subunit (sigma70/sigma32)